MLKFHVKHGFFLELREHQRYMMYDNEIARSTKHAWLAIYCTTVAPISGRSTVPQSIVVESDNSF